MNTIEILFWISFIIVFYTYIGYGIILWVLVKLKKVFGNIQNTPVKDYQPEVTILITAYNEQDFIDRKVRNTQELDYPSHKLKQIWVTDGSNDNSSKLLQNYKNVEVLHKPERRGKIAAINRAVKYVNTPIVLFTDANTMLGKESVKRIVALFANEKTGCVSGEKRVSCEKSDSAAASGEGLYWKYESTLKKMDAKLNSVVGAAGELFAIRTHLFNEVEGDTILDDFIISLRVAMQGYTIQYDTEAFAIETGSENVEEELKRKIRIAAGGIQAIVRLLPLLNIFKYKMLSFQYFSHRVLRWTITPFMLPLLLAFNLALFPQSVFYQRIMLLQAIFYGMVILGSLLQNYKSKIKGIFVPYYFFIMNYAVFRGMWRYFFGTQSVNWERAKRKAQLTA